MKQESVWERFVKAYAQAGVKLESYGWIVIIAWYLFQCGLLAIGIYYIGWYVLVPVILYNILVFFIIKTAQYL